MCVNAGILATCYVVLYPLAVVRIVEKISAYFRGEGGGMNRIEELHHAYHICNGALA